MRSFSSLDTVLDIISYLNFLLSILNVQTIFLLSSMLFWVEETKMHLILSPGNSAQNVTSSENVEYSIAGRTVRMSIQANVTCLKNMSYAAIEKVKKDTQGSTMATRHTAVYDEVAPRK